MLPSDPRNTRLREAFQKAKTAINQSWKVDVKRTPWPWKLYGNLPSDPGKKGKESHPNPLERILKFTNNFSKVTWAEDFTSEIVSFMVNNQVATEEQLWAFIDSQLGLEPPANAAPRIVELARSRLHSLAVATANMPDQNPPSDTDPLRRERSRAVRELLDEFNSDSFRFKWAVVGEIAREGPGAIQAVVKYFRKDWRQAPREKELPNSHLTPHVCLSLVLDFWDKVATQLQSEALDENLLREKLGAHFVSADHLELFVRAYQSSPPHLRWEPAHPWTHSIPYLSQFFHGVDSVPSRDSPRGLDPPQFEIEAQHGHTSPGTPERGSRDQATEPVPRPSPLASFIVRREGHLSRINTAFDALRKPPYRVALVGSPGLGKTYIARDYAEECKGNGWTVRSLACANIGRLDHSFRELARDVGLAPDTTLDAGAVRDAVFDRLKGQDKCLLIFDGASNTAAVQACFPPETANIRVLITSNELSWGHLAKIVEIDDRFELGEAREFLTKRLPEIGRLADDLAEFFLRHPLLLDFAATYLDKTGKTTPKAISRFLKDNHSLEQALKGSFGESGPREYFEMLFQGVPQEARETLKLCAVLDPDSIPDVFLEQTTPQQTDDVLRSLVAWRFFVPQDVPWAPGAVFRMHSAIHQAIRSYLLDHELPAIKAAVQVLLKEFTFQWVRQETWASSMVFFSNAHWVGNLVFQLKDPTGTECAFALWLRVASYLGSIGRREELSTWLEKVLKWAQLLHLEERPEMAHLYHELASTELRWDVPRAIKWQESAIDFARRHPDSDLPLCVALRCLGCQYLRVGQMGPAVDALREAETLLQDMVDGHKGDPERVYHVYHHLICGINELLRGNLSRALSLLMTARGEFSNTGADTPLPMVEYFLGETQRILVAKRHPDGGGDYGKMYDHFRRAAELFRRSALRSHCIGDVPTIRRILGATDLPSRRPSSLLLPSQLRRIQDPHFIDGEPQILDEVIFTERPERLAEIGAHFKQGCPATVVISGYPGFGKSWLALSFAEARAEEYDKIAWLRAETLADLTTSVESVSREWGVFPSPTGRLDADIDHEHRGGKGLLARFHEAVSRPDGTRWLLILDNVEDEALVREVLPRKAMGDVLITTKSQTLGTDRAGWHRIDLKAGMLLGEAIALLTKSGARGDPTPLAERLHCIPLLLNQAVTYIRKSGIQTFAEYMNLLNRQPEKLNAKISAPLSYDCRTFEQALNLAVTEAEKQTSEAVHLLGVLATLAPEQVPIDLLFTSYPTAGEIATWPSLGLELNEAIAALMTWGLTRVAGSGNHRVLTTHRAILDYAWQRMNRVDQNNCRAVAFSLLAKAFPAPEPWEVLTSQDIEVSRLLYPHWEHVWKKHIRQNPLSAPDPLAAFSLAARVAVYLRKIGDLNTAFFVGDDAYRRIKDSDLRDTLEVGKLADGLSVTIRALEFPARASRERSLAEEALSIVRRHRADDPFSIARQLNHLGISIGDQASELQDAKRKQQLLKESRRTLQRSLEVLDSVKPDAATRDRWRLSRSDALRNLGQVLERLYRITGKEALLEEAMQVTKKALKLAPDAAAIGRAYHRLGSLYQRAGRLTEARKWMEKAYETNMAAHPPRHVALAKDLRHKATILTQLGDPKSLHQASIDLREAEQIYVESVGANSPGCHEIQKQIAALINQQRWVQPLDESG